MTNLSRYTNQGCRTPECRQAFADYQRERGRRVSAQLKARKLAQGCQICGYRKSAHALQYHHRDPSTKSFGRHRSFASFARGVGEQKLQAELAKCDVLCANCHAELTEAEANWP
jgi:hypothetical protein